MNTKLLLTIGIIAVAFTACSKNKLNTKPALELLSVSTEDVPKNGDLIISLKYRDKEGDISDSIFLSKTRLNKKQTTTYNNSFGFAVPNAPMNPVGFLDITLDRFKLPSAQNPGTPPEPDTVQIKIWLKDLAKNVSDTLVIPQIIIRR